MQITTRPITDLVPYANNARTHSTAQVSGLAGTIGAIRWTSPVLYDDAGIIAGHGRVMAAQRIYDQGGTILGPDGEALPPGTVPAIYMPGLSEAERRALILADNKHADKAGWDEELLRLELDDLRGLDFDLELTGFDVGDLDLLSFKAEKKKDKAAAREEAKKKSLSTELAPTDEERAAFESKKILVEFSGGKDSSAAAWWCKNFFPDHEIELCFVDLGADFYGFQGHLAEFAESLGARLRVLRTDKNIIDVFLERRAWPHFAHPYCHDFLHGALDKRWKEESPDGIVIVRGGRAAEKNAVGKINTSRFLKIGRVSEYSFFQPLYFETKDSAETILGLADLPIWEGYGRGLKRTACRVCPGQRPAAYAAIRANYPDVWEELLFLEKRLGPGFWGDNSNPKKKKLEQLADKGQAVFLDRAL